MRIFQLVDRLGLIDMNAYLLKIIYLMIWYFNETQFDEILNQSIFLLFFRSQQINEFPHFKL